MAGSVGWSVTASAGVSNGHHPKLNEAAMKPCHALAVEVEVFQSNSSIMPKSELASHVRQYLTQTDPEVGGGGTAFGAQLGEFFQKHVELIQLGVRGAEEGHGRHLRFNEASSSTLYICKLNDDGFQAEDIYLDDGEATDAAVRQIVLPARELQGLWENLIFDQGLKGRLLRYVNTAMLLSDKGVDPHMISWNRVVLLHGPPGTGKTSLCRALAQKLSIRLSGRFKYGHLVEINSHSLFSKWFSESGKLVHKMFAHVQELVEDTSAFVCILIDEVESLVAARKSSGNEPSDAIRVVNAVLTQIDQLKRFNNVLVMTTSNITGTIDLAFVDRADMKEYVGLPSAAACYSMLRGSIHELRDKGLVSLMDSPIYSVPPTTETEGLDEASGPSSGLDPSRVLMQIAQRCSTLSGRAMRRLPFIALTECEVEESAQISAEAFLRALDKAVEILVAEQGRFSGN